MPWTKTKGGGSCADDEWAVVADDDGSTAGCHATEAEADEQIAALYADEESGEAAAAEWHAIVILEGHRTTDNRELVNLDHRTLPLPLMSQPSTEHGGMFNEPARLAGSIRTLERRDGALGPEWYATGVYDSGDAGQELRRMVDEGTLRWVSADVEATEFEMVEEGDGCQSDDPADWMNDCVVVQRVLAGNIVGMTALPIPAFPQAVIAPIGVDLGQAVERGREAAEGLGMVASGCVHCEDFDVPNVAPAEWFDDPQLAGPTPLTIGDDGRVFGHLATWGTCHVGIGGACVTPPRSESGYAHFLTGVVDTTGGQRPVGKLTLAGGHADTRLGYRAASQHYDDTDSAYAYVNAGEDEHGIWMAGTLRPSVTRDQVRTARACGISGDWRPIGGRHELVAACSVNVPGFPVPRVAAGYVDGEMVGLVAAGAIPAFGNVPLVADDRIPELEARLGRLEVMASVLAPLAAARIVERMAGTVPAAT